MPGFIVNNIGGDRKRGVQPTANYYYTYLWNIDSLFVDSGFLSGFTNFYKSLSDVGLIHAKDMTLPAFSVSKDMLIGGSLEYKFAKAVSYDDVKITWYDTVGLIDTLKKWRESVWDPKTGLAPYGDYKKLTVQRQYITNDDGDVSDDVTYRLHGSWPSTIRHGDLTYTNSDVKIVEVSVTYDYAIEYRGDPGPLGS